MFGGFDKDSYDALGDSVMGPIRANTNLRWVGFYLAHARDAYGSTWTSRRARAPQVSTWRFLRSEGWGRAPIYICRQFVGGATNPGWTEANGRADAQHVLRLASMDNPGNLVDIEVGATIYIDLENDGFMSDTHAVNYLRGWFSEIAGAGYRPGAYCAHAITGTMVGHSDAQLIRTAFPNVAVWFVRIPEVQTAVYNEAEGRLIIPPASDYQDADGAMPRFGQLACQFAWYNDGRAYKGANLRTSVTATHRVAPIDFDGARIPDPSHPEDRAALAFAFHRTGQPAAFALESQAAVWQYFDGSWGDWGQLVASAAATTGMADLGYGRWFDTASMAAVSRHPGLVDIFGQGIDGSIWTAWRSEDAGGVDGVWSPVPQILNPTMPARPGSAVAAVSRRTDFIDVFFFNRRHELTATWWNPFDMNWQGHTGPITPGASFAPASNIEALTSPADPERLDVFAVDVANSVRWVQWRGGMPWQTQAAAVLGGADPAVGVAGAWHAGAIHLVVAQRDGTLTHVSHPSGDIADPAGWTIRGALPSLGTVARPMGIRLASLDRGLVLVVVASNATLFWNLWNGAWSMPGSDTAAPAYSTSGRLAITVFDANTVDVMLPNFDGEIVVRRLTVSSSLPVPMLTVTGAWTSML